jgi:hypothetical protein
LNVTRTCWPATFVVTGALGFLWLLLWIVLYRVPEQHPWITEAERAHILSDRAGNRAQQVMWLPGWLKLLTYGQTWAVVIGVCGRVLTAAAAELTATETLSSRRRIDLAAAAEASLIFSRQLVAAIRERQLPTVRLS